MARMRYNRKTNKFQNVNSPVDVPVPTGEIVEPQTGDWEWSDVPGKETPMPPSAARVPKPKPVTPTTGFRATGDVKDRPRYVGLQRFTSPQPTEETPPAQGLNLSEALSEFFSQYNLDPSLASALLGVGGTGGGGGGVSRADRERASREMRRAGQKAKSDYSKLAEDLFNRSMQSAGDYYSGREQVARQQISDATKQFLENLIQPTAYADVPLPNVPVAQQGLSEALGAYGATGDLARQVAGETQGEMDFARQLSERSATQLQQAQQAYFDALRNAATGGQLAAETALTQNLEGMRGQSRAEAEAIRRQLMMQGIEALMAGRQNAAQAFL